MLKKSLLLFFTFIAILFSACKKMPTASFSTSKASAEIDEVITFTNTSSDAVSYSWTFGDGGVSTDESPSHAYTAAGTYSVTLTAYSKKEKKSATMTKTIIVNMESYRFSGSIDGTNTSYNTALENYGNFIGSDGSVGFPISTKIVHSGIADIDNNDRPSIVIKIGTLTYSGGSIAPSADFLGFITAKTYAYSAGAANGVVIQYIDLSGEIWQTDFSTADQSGSSFVITQVTNVTEPFGDERVSFKATFNAKLYNSSGSSKTFSNCYYYATFGNI